MGKITAALLCMALMVPGIMVFAGASSGNLPEESPGPVWSKVNSYSFEMQIMPGSSNSVLMDGGSGTLPSPGQRVGLPPECREALSVVPGWLRDDLQLKFRVLPHDQAVTLANLILDDEGNRTMDEIAFVAAHLSRETIMNEYFFPSIIKDNAELVYAHDELVPYATIVEKDDYTTIVYNTEEGPLELPRDIYYWYVVHPDLGDELPTYVDPDYNYVEDSPRDRDYGVPPPRGKFWRDWFFVHNKTGQPLLPDLLNSTTTFLDGIRAVNTWISESMTFTSDNERPNQPVRIYQKGIGRCGEHQDMRSAAGRAALLPIVPTSNNAEDHVWNEFWKGRWVHWDGTYDRPYIYEQGWGKTLSSVWNQRGDGWTWDVTSRYTDVCPLDVTVTDQRGLPADGALVEIKTEMYYVEELKTTTNFATTDHTGKLTFMLGDERNYWGTADGGELGNDPLTGDVAPREIAMNTSAGTEYSVSFRLPKSAESPKYTPLPTGNSGHFAFKANITYRVKDHITRGKNAFTGDTFEDRGPGGDITAFILDQDEMRAYSMGGPFVAPYYRERVEGDQVEFTLWNYEPYYLVLWNGYSQRTVKTVNVSVDIWGFVESSIDMEPGEEFELGELMEVSGMAHGSQGIDEVRVMVRNMTDWMEAYVFQVDPSEYFWNVDVPTTGFPIGELEIWAMATDGNHTHYSVATVMMVDTRPPEVVIRDASEGPYHVEDTITISGSVDDFGTIEELYYTVDGTTSPATPIMVPSDGNWFLTIDLYDIGYGDHSITVFARDASGNTGSDTIELDIGESEPPFVRVLSPESGTLVRKGEPVTFTGEVFDNIEVSGLSLSVDGGRTMDITSSIRPDGSFSHDMGTNEAYLQDGPHTISVTALDPSGNEFCVDREIIIDGTAPGIIFRTEEGRLFGPHHPIPITGELEDENGIGSFRWSLGSLGPFDAADAVSGGAFELYLGEGLELPEGEVTLTLHAEDTVGNSRELELDLFFDPAGPTIELGEVPELVLKGEDLRLTGSVFDESGLKEVEISADGLGVIRSIYGTGPLNIDEMIDTKAFPPGERTVRVRAVDSLGNEAVGEVTVSVVSLTTDSDDDGMPDWWEYMMGTDLLVDDSGLDPDGDGFTNLEEYRGSDGRGGNDDYTDPRDAGSHPSPVSGEEGGSSLSLVLLFLGIILVLGSIIFIFARIMKRG